MSLVYRCDRCDGLLEDDVCWGCGLEWVSS